MKTREDQHVRIGVLRGMAVLTPDALSSVAYATDQMESVLAVLIAAGAAKSYISDVLGYSMLGTGVIVVLAFLLYLAYQNIIRHYPMGGGAYAIGLNDLGKPFGLSAASTLIIGYTLTVAVSVASGIDAIGPVIPFVGTHKLLFNIILTLAIMLLNLRGTGESATVFVPFTYLFVGCIILLGFTALIEGIAHPQQIHVPTAAGVHMVQGMSLYLFLRMFANGCSALTGIEAVSNSVPVFKEPSSARARRLLLTLVITLSLLFFVVSGVATVHGLTYNPQVPLINQEALTLFGTSGIGYAVTVVISFSTMCILAIAANTAFTGCPALWSSMARDGYMPRWVLHKGDRLVYSNGIIFLTFISLLLTIAFDANVSRLIPLYGVSVFYTFTISQLGMVARKFREKGKHWIPSAIGSMFGLLMTAAACVIFLVTHFTDGAWMILVCVPLMVIMFSKIRKHYQCIREELRYDFSKPFETTTEGITIVPIASVNKASVRALQYAASNFKNVVAVTVISGDSEDQMKRQQEKIERDWERLGSGIRLITIHSQYRAVARRLQRFVEFELGKYNPEHITIVIPQFITRRWWHKLLHNKTGSYLMAWLLLNKSVKVVTVPYRLMQ
ncbi:APC family permease [Alicyclobacillus cycloheptanicus]|uniref:Amino acid transporter n=1 Tax=Alicyclobacillus cycloheptanicus TaxID=1457 RepID=A0ABT9XHD7_9BACL|nr:APC family permease [Alicyclobacillus cycloheptanicus]MDQ0189703.1 amino acid transporter [Alicyclobacillus cycloheptanicus]WDM01915.1 APC family permease [Alicyclobacillus cycloheptanicus]